MPSLTGRADGHLVIYNHFILFCISSFFSYINFTARSGHESNRTRNHFCFVTYQELCKPIQLRQQTRRRDANAGNFNKIFTFAACGNALRNSARNFQMSAIFDQNFQVHHYEFPKPSSILNLAIAFLFVEINQQKLLGALFRWFHQLFFSKLLTFDRPCNCVHFTFHLHAMHENHFLRSKSNAAACWAWHF